MIIGDIILQGLHNCRGREVWTRQATVLFKHIDEGLIWRRARKLMIMKIEVGMASPNMPSSIHERTHHRSCSKETLHVKWTHDEAKCSSPRGSDGHQNVLWSISYSHVVREQVKSKKPGVFQSRNKQTQTQTQTKQTQQRKTPRTFVKHYAFRKYNPCNAHVIPDIFHGTKNEHFFRHENVPQANIAR